MLPENPKTYVKVEGERTFAGEVRLELLKAVIEKKKPFRFKAYGFSMSPFIRDKDILTIKPVPVGIPVPGDVVAFEQADIQKLIVHRVVKRGDNGFLIKGDNMYEFDGLVPPVNIHGIVTRVERNSRIVYAGLGRERGLIAFLSRHGILVRFFRIILFPYRIGAAGLRKIQVLAGYPPGQ